MHARTRERKRERECERERTRGSEFASERKSRDMCVAHIEKEQRGIHRERAEIYIEKEQRYT